MTHIREHILNIAALVMSVIAGLETKEIEQHIMFCMGFVVAITAAVNNTLEIIKKRKNKSNDTK